MPQQQQVKQYKPLYEVQSHNITLIMTKSMSKVNEVWTKSRNCSLFQFNLDGSKYLVNTKTSPIQKTIQSTVSNSSKVAQKGKQKKPILATVSTPVERKIKRRRDRAAERKLGDSSAS